MQITLRLRCDADQLFDWLSVEVVGKGAPESVYRVVCPVGYELSARLEEAFQVYRVAVTELGFLPPDVFA